MNASSLYFWTGLVEGSDVMNPLQWHLHRTVGYKKQHQLLHYISNGQNPHLSYGNMAIYTLTKIMLFATLVGLAIEPTLSFPTPETVWKLLNEKSGGFLGVLPGGGIHAMATLSNNANQFKPSFPTPTTIRLESALYPAVYVILDNGTMKAGTPSGGNDIFEMLSADNTESIVFRSTLTSAGTDCHIAFDSEGEAHGPCGTSSMEHEAHFTKILYY